jgi:hypothetical protein
MDLSLTSDALPQTLQDDYHVPESSEPVILMAPNPCRSTILRLIETRERMTGWRGVRGPAAAPVFSREKAIGAECQRKEDKLLDSIQ